MNKPLKKTRTKNKNNKKKKKIKKIQKTKSIFNQKISKITLNKVAIIT